MRGQSTLYREAVGESLVLAMEVDPKVICMGVGVADPKGIFGTTLQARLKFPDRVLETPLSENMLTGACVGLALEGWKPVLVHARTDFLMLTMEQLINTAAKWPYMNKGKPLTFAVRALIGRGWGQGPQHSQALHALFAHVPGLNVVMPAGTAGAAHALPWALTQPQPTIIIEHRRLYETDIDLRQFDTEDRDNANVTIACFSASILDVIEAVRFVKSEGIKTAVFCIERVAPLDSEAILTSVEQTQRLVVFDVGHAVCGLSTELVARAANRVPGVRIRQVTPPFVPCPTSLVLEREWYPSATSLVEAIHQVLDVESPPPVGIEIEPDHRFLGPF